MILEGADLSNVNLSWANLGAANLSGANLSGADLSNANLSEADLTGANLRESYLRHAVLSKANLDHANLRDANLDLASLRDANLTGANLRNTSLIRSILLGADLTGANIEGCVLPPKEMRIGTIMPDLPYRCPPTGGFTAWKKALSIDTTLVDHQHLNWLPYSFLHDKNVGKVLIKLYIPEDAKRSSGNSAKCRCDRAVVVDIIDITSNVSVSAARSFYEYSFIYNIGQTVESEFDDDRWNECSKGIHFFMTKEEALDFCFR